MGDLGKKKKTEQSCSAGFCFAFHTPLSSLSTPIMGKTLVAKIIDHLQLVILHPSTRWGSAVPFCGVQSYIWVPKRKQERDSAQGAGCRSNGK